MKFTDDWLKTQLLDPRKKVASTYDLAHRIGQAIKENEIDLSEFDVLTQILNKANYYSGSGEYSKTRNLLVRSKLKSCGLDEVKVIKKVAGEIAVESGMLGIADLAVKDQLLKGDFSNKDIREKESKGLCLSMETGGDGLFPVQLRIVEGSEPLLSEKEYKLVESTTETITIQCTSGEIVVGDLFNLGESSVRVKIDPGSYRVCGYVFDNHKDFRANYFILAKE